jgi:hypothetical protein
MKYEERTRIIGQWLQEEVLPRYTPPPKMNNETLKKELHHIVEDVNSFISAKLNHAEFKIHLQKIDKKIRTTHTNRTWPTIATFVKATKDTHTQTAPMIEGTTIEQSPFHIELKRMERGEPIPARFLHSTELHQQIVQETNISYAHLQNLLRKYTGE